MLPPGLRVRRDIGNKRVVSTASAAAERADLKSLFATTVERGESNSVLILGPRGVGKTDMVSDCNSSFQRCLTNRYFKVDAVCEEVLASAARAELTLVRLHGLTETDDRLALREIARQV